MAIIQFEDGTKVEFQGNPTQQDVEEVALKLGIKKSTPAPAGKQPDFLDKLEKGVTTIFPGKKVGEAVGTSIAAINQYAQGNTQAGNDIIDTQVSPKEVGGDLLKVGATVAGSVLSPATSLLGKTAQFGALGAVSGAGEAMTQDKSAEDIAKDSAKGAAIGAGTGLAFGLAEKGITKLSDLAGRTGDKIQTSVIKPSQADIKDGFSIETIKKHNLGGSLKQTFEKTDTKLDSLSKELNTKLGQSNATIDLNRSYENTAKKLLGNKFESFGSNSQMENSLENLRKEIVNSAGQNGIVSIPEAQIVKRASGHFGAWQFGVPTPEATASQKVYNTFYNELKTEIEKNSPAGVKEINKQISELIPVMNALIRRIPVAERNSAISLTDIITLSAASLEPRALALSLMNFASKSGKVGAALSKTPAVGQAVSRGVQGAEQIGQAIVGR